MEHKKELEAEVRATDWLPVVPGDSSNRSVYGGPVETGVGAAIWLSCFMEGSVGRAQSAMWHT